MKRRPRWVIDASALLAYLVKEDGWEKVGRALAERAALSTLNLAEAQCVLAEAGGDPGRVEPDLRARGIRGDSLRIVDFDSRAGLELARLKARMYGHYPRGARPSLADFALLALGRVLDAAVLTSDSSIAWIDVGVKVVHFRPWEMKPRPPGVPARL